jgi:hypothetical protein
MMKGQTYQSWRGCTWHDVTELLVHEVLMLVLEEQVARPQTLNQIPQRHCDLTDFGFVRTELTG